MYLIHGWNSDPTQWANAIKGDETRLGMKQRITSQLISQYNGKLPLMGQSPECDMVETDIAIWQICTLDWSGPWGLRTTMPSSSTDFPFQAWANAQDPGKDLAKKLLIGNYNFVHFIAHSAGSRVAHEAAKLLKTDSINPPLIHMTFLDAYHPWPTILCDYGEATDWAEQYFDTRPILVPLINQETTKIHLRNAYNFDITALDPLVDPPSDITDLAGGHAHAWPHQWYQFTIDHKEIFNDGFALSLESGNNQLPSHGDNKRGHICVFSSVFDKTCSESSKPGLTIIGNIACENLFDCYITDINKLIKSDTGTVSFPSPDYLKLINGSPVWAQLPLEIGEPVNFISFDYSFKRDAEGLLSVFFDNQLVYRADQRLDEAGVVSHSGDLPIGDITGGTHSLSFRLDAYNGMKSEIDISNVKLGNKQAVENQPPVANAGADQTVNAGVKVTLNGSGSNDPDQGPSAITYSWSQTGGPSVTMTNPVTAMPDFIPLVAGTYIFRLSVNDGLTESATDTVTVTVNDAAAAATSLTIQAPNGGEVWNEGGKQTITWGSQGIDSKKSLLIYLSTNNGLNWKKITSAKNLGSKIWKIPKKAYISKQTLIKICLNQKAPLCDTSDAVFNINKAPVAEAGVKQTVIVGSEVILNGGASYDVDNGPATITYKWVQTRGPLVTLNGADTAMPSFTPTLKGTYIFGLIASDGSADSKQDKVTVSVKAPPIIH